MLSADAAFALAIDAAAAIAASATAPLLPCHVYARCLRQCHSPFHTPDDVLRRYCYCRFSRATLAAAVFAMLISLRRHITPRFFMPPLYDAAITFDDFDAAIHASALPMLRHAFNALLPPALRAAMLTEAFT